MNRFDRPRQSLAIAIAFLAGFVDALGFMSGDRYFVSFMSGNTTRLAVDLATAPRTALVPALLILGFIAGVAGGAAVVARAGPWRKPALMAVVAALLALGGAFHMAERTDAALGALVLAMGAVNNMFQRDGEVAVGLTYMTGALVKLGQAIGGVLSGRRYTGWGAYLLLWGGLFAGGTTGSLLFAHFSAGVFWLAVLLAAALTAWAWRVAARDAG